MPPLEILMYYFTIKILILYLHKVYLFYVIPHIISMSYTRVVLEQQRQQQQS